MNNAMIDKAAAECVEEILVSARTDGGEPWFAIVRRKMQRVHDYATSCNTDRNCDGSNPVLPTDGCGGEVVGEAPETTGEMG